MDNSTANMKSRETSQDNLYNNLDRILEKILSMVNKQVGLIDASRTDQDRAIRRHVTDSVSDDTIELIGLVQTRREAFCD
jgi:hypothetical protein